jgi:hypothetical protein
MAFIAADISAAAGPAMAAPIPTAKIAALKVCNIGFMAVSPNLILSKS